jgi:rSAM/selenodomain-associated transferase 1
MDACLMCLMVKAPRPGRVKTRLASAVGPHGAAALARAFLEDTLAVLRRLPWAQVVVSLAGAAGSLDLPADVEIWEQGDGDLGDRMEHALRRALERRRRAFVVGADVPGLPPRVLEAARTALEHHPAVLGPTPDGGFYLLGLDRCEPGLLAGLPWSRTETLARTEERLRERGRAAALVEEWSDVDVPEDLLRLARAIAAGEVHAPATTRALTSLG